MQKEPVIIKEYKALLRCTTAEKARKHLGVADTQDVLEAFKREAERIVDTLATQMAEIASAFLENFDQLEYYNGRCTKRSIYKLYKQIDKHNLISYTRGEGRNETGFRETSDTFDIRELGKYDNLDVPKDWGEGAYMFLMGTIRISCAEYEDALKKVYMELKRVC